MLAFYLNHKWKIIIGGTIITSFGVFGIKTVFGFAFKLLLGMIGIGICVAGVWIFMSRGDKILHTPIIKELQKSRKDIEKVIGTYEVPTVKDWVIVKTHTTKPGPKIPMLQYTTQLKGTKGQANIVCRGVYVDVRDEENHMKKKEWVIEKMRLELAGISHVQAMYEMVILDKNLTQHVFVENAHVEEIEENNNSNNNNGSKNTKQK
eukprot:TRINITY_DN1951_c0_g2_i1.p1 TRINITY_DN1951_c0_g2~~TRINITY_DN1951_c0_g2_i1.p1  ORF type:complete len:206 (-),score=36.45 TRINITY_DN1951_c0_g2_i1:12-629(-)